MDYYQNNSNMQNHDMSGNANDRGGLSTAAQVCGIISVIFGILSLISCCLGYLSIPIGALGILFAILSRRKGQPLPRICKTGLTLSIIGLVIGVIMLMLTIYSAITDPNFWESMRDAYTQYEEMYEELYGTDIYDAGGTELEGYGNLSL